METRKKQIKQSHFCEVVFDLHFKNRKNIKT